WTRHDTRLRRRKRLFDGTSIDTDPTIGMANAPTRGPRTHVPTDAEIVKVWNALRDDDYGDIVRLLMLTLCRLSEIGDLTWDEVAFPAGLIRLPAARTKTGVARDVPMSALVRRILEAPAARGRRPGAGVWYRSGRVCRLDTSQGRTRSTRRRH